MNTRRLLLHLVAIVIVGAWLCGRAQVLFAADGPTKRVIVKLAVQAAPEGALGGNTAAVASQRAEIATTRSALVAALPEGGWRTTAEFKTIPFVALEVDDDALRALERSGFVAGIEEDRVHRPMLFQSDRIVEADQSWAEGFEGTGQTIAILDTGVDATQPFLRGRVVSEACFSMVPSCPNDSTEQIGVGAGAPCQFDTDCDHGTHVAGIAAGHGKDVSGMARGANIIAMQIFSPFCAPELEAPCLPGSAISSEILALERVGELQGQFDIAAVNMSLGGRTFSSRSECDRANAAEKAAIDDLGSRGIAVVVAAGNDGAIDALSEPGCISSVVSVGATDDQDNVAPFSNSVPSLSLLAPGVDVTSSLSNGRFEAFSGTSMAAPHVAGAWAMLKQKAPTASVDTVLNTLQATGVTVLDMRNGFTTQRIRIRHALDALSADTCSTWTALGKVALPSDFFDFPGPFGAQITPDDRQILVNKDVAGERWAITRNVVDGSATGNVFTSAADPQFVYCRPAVASPTLECFGATPCANEGKGIIRSVDGKRILVNKDVNGERWAISKNLDSGTLTGNVFVAGSSTPSFVFCEPQGGDRYHCSGSGPCAGPGACEAEWHSLGDVSLSCTFFGADACSVSADER